MLEPHYALRLAVEVFKGLKITIAIFTLDEKQIIWMDKLSQMDKSSDVKMGQTNFQTSKGTSRPKSDLNSHSDRLRRTNGRFARLGGMELAKGAMVLHQLH